MKNVNRELHDRILAHQSRLIGTENAIAEKAAKPWRRGWGAASKVLEQGLPAPTRQSQDNLIEEISALFGKAATESEESLGKDLLDQVQTEHRIVLKSLFKSFPLRVWENAGEIKRIQESRESMEVDIVRPIDAKTAERLIHHPIRGKHFRDRYRDIGRRTRNRLEKEITTGIAKGESIPNIKGRVRRTARTSAREANAVARTEVHNVSNRVHEEAYQANRHVLNGVEYLATLDERTCEICGLHDRQVFYFEGKESGYADRPFIPVHPLCRCVYVPVTRFKEIFGDAVPAGQRASVFGPVEREKTWSEWIVKQSPGVQDSIVGKRAGAMLRAGKLNLGDLTTQRGRRRTVEELERLADTE